MDTLTESMHDSYKERIVGFFQTTGRSNPFPPVPALSPVRSPVLSQSPIMQASLRSLCLLVAYLTLVGFGVAAIANFAFAQDSNSKEGVVQMVPPPEPVRIALLAKETEQALSLLKSLDAEQPQQADQWSFYRAVALQDAERFAEANQTLRALIAAHPKSVWVQKALYRRAEVCQRLGLFDEAEAIYREAASRLRSKDRQSELAELYLKLAEQLTQTDEANPNAKAPRYAEALALYQKVLDLEVHVDVRARVLMQMGHSSIGLNQPVPAAQYFERVGKLELPAEHPMRWEAVRAMGRQWIAGQRYSEALHAMEDFLRDAQTVAIDAAEHPQAHAAFERAQASAYRVTGDAWLGQQRLPLALGDRAR